MKREPLVHFVAMALALFVVAEVVDAKRGEVIEVDALEVEARIRQMESAQGAPLTDRERALAELAHVDEMILAREGRALGLDDDPRIRSILAQKVLQLMSMEMSQPTDRELRAYFDEHQGRYALPPSVTVDQLLEIREGAGSSGQLRPGGDASTPGGAPPPDATPEALASTGAFEHTALRQVTRNELSLSFGPRTADRVFDAPVGTWVGPHDTERGLLWFRTVERHDAAPPPPFDELVGQVRFDWMSEREEPYLQARVAELRERYVVRVLDADDARR